MRASTTSRTSASRLPRDRLVVITGPSGSGKSSLAFDTIYAEGQRRYVESLSAYARQFLEQLAKPDVESIEGLSPAIAIEQRALAKSPRSTVGTVTEIADYLRLLFARVGDAALPELRQAHRGADRAADRRPHPRRSARARAPPSSPPSPAPAAASSSWRSSASAARGSCARGSTGRSIDLGDEIVLDRSKVHDLDVVVDRIVGEGGASRGGSPTRSSWR